MALHPGLVPCVPVVPSGRAYGSATCMQTAVPSGLSLDRLRCRQAGTYLLLEKLKQSAYRRLFKRVALLHAQAEPAKAFQIPLGAPLPVAQHGDGFYRGRMLHAWSWWCTFHSMSDAS